MWWWWAAGCREPETSDTDPTPHTAHTAAHTGGADHSGSTQSHHSASHTADHTGGTSPTADTGPGLDCEGLPATLEPAVPVAGHASYDLAFDQLGHLVGSDGTSLLRTSFDGTFEVLAPGIGSTAGLDFLPDGDLVVSVERSGDLERVRPTGARTVIAGGLGAYAVEVGPDGKVWTANNRSLDRFDPDTGARETIVPASLGRTPRTFNFDRTSSALLVAEQNGGLLRIPLDGAFDPAGPPVELYAGIPPGPDTMAIDACGNAYVTVFPTDLYRVGEDGTGSEVLSFTVFDTFLHGLEFGSGIGGWRADRLYGSRPFAGNVVAELDVGVPSAHP